LTFDLKNSQALNEEEKLLVETKLASRLTTDAVLYGVMKTEAKLEIKKLLSNDF
jgi:hypothetical protein